ncbi:MAG: SPOR domain-containing protein [bacterium]|nr:SPOR domain-containing protein [bacterium]
MKKKTGAQEHTIIIGTILASVLVFVLGFFLGRAWVMMPQEKMVQVKKESPSPVIVAPEPEGEDFEDTLAKLKQKKIMEEAMKTKEAQFEIKRNQKEKEERKQKEEKMKLAILLEEKRKQQEQEKIKMALAKKEKERLQALQEKELDEKKKAEAKKKEEIRLKELAEKKEVSPRAEAKKVGQDSQSSVQKTEEKAKEEKITQGDISPQTPEVPSEEGKYTIQLQSSRDRQKVEELLTELRNRGYAAYVIQADLKEKGVWYRIRLGKYDSKEEAIQDAERLKNMGVFSSYLITKR